MLCLCLSSLSLLSTGCSKASIARSQFSARYSCPSSQLTLAEGTEDGDQQTPIDVEGCGHKAAYMCTIRQWEDGSGGDVCVERHRVIITATDGSTYSAWGDFRALIDELPAAITKAAIASAAHDIPCLAGQITVIGKGAHGWPNMLQGCGQRITYQFNEGSGPAQPGGPVQPTYPVGFVVSARLPVAGP